MTPNYAIEVVFCLRKLLKYSPSIQSIKMKNCGLNANTMCGLIPAISDSKSLLCLHIGSNPGVCDAVYE